MKSFGDCLKKNGLGDYEKAILTSKKDALMGEGYEAHNAAVAAVTAYRDDLLERRAAIYKEIGVAEPAPKKAKKPEPPTPEQKEAEKQAKVAAKAANKQAKAEERKAKAKAAREAARGEGLTNNVKLKKLFHKIGIDIRERSDITGEKGKGAKKTGAMVGTFRQSGKPADYWGQKLVEEGWLDVESQEERGNEDMRASADDVHAFMRRIFDGEPVFKVAEMAEKIGGAAAEDLAPESVNAILSEAQDFPIADILDVFDLDAEARAAWIESESVIEDIGERAAMRAENGENYVEAARAEIESRARESAAAANQQAPQVAEAEADPLELVGQTPAEVKAAEEKAKAEAEAKARDDAKPTGPTVKVDQADIFNTQDTLFPSGTRETAAPKVESPKAEAPKAEAPVAEAPKVEAKVAPQFLRAETEALIRDQRWAKQAGSSVRDEIDRATEIVKGRTPTKKDVLWFLSRANKFERLEKIEKMSPEVSRALRAIAEAIKARLARPAEPMLSLGPVWRSALSDAIATKAPFSKDGTIGAGQLSLWLAARSKDGTIKPAELEWSGLTDWLKATGERATKDQVLAFLRDNGVQVETKMLGEAEFVAGLRMSDLEDGERIIRDDAGNVMGRGIDIPEAVVSAQARLERLAKQWQKNGDDAKAEKLFRQAADLDRWHESYSGYGMPNETKFTNWQLPGGRNYREMLLTLPVRGGVNWDEVGGIMRKYDIPGDQMPGETDSAMLGRILRVFGTRMSQKELQFLTAQQNAYKEAIGFQQGHYGAIAPNVLAHVRFNERTDADGKRVLFIEEIQSDWAQKGRKQGFAGKITQEDAKRFFDIRDSDWEKMDDAQRESYRQEMNERSRGIPSAPFVNKTEAWVALSLKRIIRYAAENGFDRVAWTTGEQQAERYDLSKQVDRIGWSERAAENGGGKHILVTMARDAGSFRFTVDKDNVVVNLQGKVPVNHSELLGKPLQDVIGKEAAEKVAGTPNGLLEGPALKLGGQGMKSFYDQIVPNVANDVLKKLGGGKVAVVDFRSTPVAVVTRSPNGEWKVVDNEGPGGPFVLTTYENESDARREVDRINAAEAWKKLGAQQGFDITPKLRESAMGGIPMFAIGTGAPVPGASLPKAQIERFVAALRKQWKNAPRIVVVDRVADLPREAPERTHGMYYDGVVYLVAENLASNDVMQWTLLHETLGHFGLQGVLGDTLDSTMQRIYETNSFVRKEADRRIAFYKENGRDLSIATGVEEALSDMAAEGRLSQISGWQMLFAQIRNALRKLGFTLKMSNADVAILLANARRYVREGEQQQVAWQTQPALSIAQTTSEAFKRWFGDSKIVDANGDPLVVYHGTTADFNIFKPHKLQPVYRQNGKEIKVANSWDMGEDRTGMPDGYHYGAVSDASILGPKEALRVRLEEADSAGTRGRQDTERHIRDLERLQGSEVRWSAENRPSGGGTWFTPDREYSFISRRNMKSDPDASIMPVYLSIKNPVYLNASQIEGAGYDFNVAKYEALGYDGAIFASDPSDLGKTGWSGATQIVAFRPDQIKSAIGNQGTFDPNNPDIRFSLGPMFTMPDDGPVGAIKQQLLDRFRFDGKSMSWINKSINTPYHLAETNKWFRPIYEGVQRFISDVSTFANDAADLSGEDILPRLQNWHDVIFNPFSFSNWKRQAELRKDLREVGRVLWAGTLGDIRPTEAQLRTGFTAKIKDTNGNEIGDVQAPPLNDTQIEHYRRIRRTLDLSIDQGIVSEMVKLTRESKRESKLESLEGARLLAKGDPTNGAEILLAALYLRLDEINDRKNNGTLSDTDAKKLTESTQDTIEQIEEKQAIATKLQDEGYAPLMRFGQYTVTISERTKNNAGGFDENNLYFGMFETKKDANRMARDMLTEFLQTNPLAEVRLGTMDTESWKVMRGLSLDTLEAFADAAGIDREDAVQKYYKMAVASRSALKRLIHRKGMAGYNEDMQRVLATFVTSQARYAARNYHYGELTKSLAAIPTEDGETRGYATQLLDYVQFPNEEAQAVRGFLFVQFIGGSIASALVNISQPGLTTVPWLSQFEPARGPLGIAKSAGMAVASVTKALAIVAKGTSNPDLKQAMERAAKEGRTEPQEIHQLYAEAIRSGIGGNSLQARKMLRLWSAAFSLAESFNRKVTFAAAYDMAKSVGMGPINAILREQGKEELATPYEFAVKAISETQFIYNKGNRPALSRGSVMATVMTFKQFAISYIEFLSRLPGREKFLALAILGLAAGAEGMPFSEDLMDLWDTIWQAMGYNANAKKSMRNVVVKTVGETAGGFLMGGLSGIPGSPFDVSGRLGFGNLIPGTAMFKRSTTDASREVAQAMGPLGSVLMSARQGFAALEAGETRSAIYNVVPKAIRDAMQAFDMAQAGYYKDLKGKRVIDTTAADAAFKAIGLMPYKVVHEGKFAQGVMQDRALHNVVEASIADRWAKGIVDKDPEAVQAAIKEMFSWNLRNPDLRIIINPQQIRQRVQSSLMTREQRLFKSTPREIRAQEFAR